MSNVVTSISRKLGLAKAGTETDPRHRREGFFDEQDNWHDAESESAATVHNAIAR